MLQTQPSTDLQFTALYTYTVFDDWLELSGVIQTNNSSDLL